MSSLVLCGVCINSVNEIEIKIHEEKKMICIFCVLEFLFENWYCFICVHACLTSDFIWLLCAFILHAMRFTVLCLSFLLSVSLAQHNQTRCLLRSKAVVCAVFSFFNLLIEVNFRSLNRRLFSK